MTIFSGHSVISRVYTSRFGNGTARWNLDRSGTKKVSGTRYSTQWKTPQKWTVPYRTVPYHAVEKRQKRGVTWALLGSLKTSRAAAFWIICRCLIVFDVSPARKALQKSSLEMTRAWTRSCAACSVRKGLIFLMLWSANRQDLVFEGQLVIKDYTKISDRSWWGNCRRT